MGFGYATVPVLFVRSQAEYACAGAPPEKEVAPEPRRNGAVVAGLARVLRGVLGAREGSGQAEACSERQGR